VRPRNPVTAPRKDNGPERKGTLGAGAYTPRENDDDGARRATGNLSQEEDDASGARPRNRVTAR